MLSPPEVIDATTSAAVGSCNTLLGSSVVSRNNEFEYTGSSTVVSVTDPVPFVNSCNRLRRAVGVNVGRYEGFWENDK